MLPNTGKKLPSVSRFDEARKDYAAVIALALVRELGGTHRSIKTLMRWTGASERTAKNWLSAKRGPSGPHLIALAQQSDEVMRAFWVLSHRPDDQGESLRADLRALLIEALRLLD